MITPPRAASIRHRPRQNTSGIACLPALSPLVSTRVKTRRGATTLVVHRARALGHPPLAPCALARPASALHHPRQSTSISHHARHASCVARAIARPPSSLHACERARLHAVPTRSHSPPSCPPGVVRTCPPPLVATCVRAHWVTATPTHPHLHVNTSACAHAAGGSACACALARHSRDPLASHAH